MAARRRRQADSDALRAPVHAILGWTHMLCDEHVALDVDEVRRIAASIAEEAAIIERDWFGHGNLTTGGGSKSAREAITAATEALRAVTSAADVTGIICEAVHDLGGWVELDHGQTDSLARIDLAVAGTPVLHALAEVGTAADAIEEHLPRLVHLGREAARIAERQRLLGDLEEAGLPHDPLTGLLDRSALDRLAHHIGPRHTVIALGLDDLDALVAGQGAAVGDLQRRRLAAMLTEQVRSSDYVFRAGRDVMAVIALSESLQATLVLVDRLRHTWDERRPPVTISVGLAGVRGRSGPQAVDEAIQGVETRVSERRSTAMVADLT